MLPLSSASSAPTPAPAPPRAPGRPSSVVLASGSSYRAEAVRRLRLDVEIDAPDVDETPLPGEPARALVLRLGEAKARAVAARRPGRIVVGSDQSATLDAGTPDELRLHKPGTAAAARAQLARLSGRSVDVFTSLVVLDGPVARRHVDATRVAVRALTAAEIERYVAADAPLDCAGAFRVESLGVALFDRVTSDDPSALVGLPLIALARLLRECGVAVP